MNSGLILSLMGLCFDLVGAFFLSAEAIGLATILSWQQRFLERPLHVFRIEGPVETDKIARKLGLRWLPSIVIGLSIFVGVYIGAAIAMFVSNYYGTPKWVGLIVSFSGGAIAAFITKAIPFLFRSLSSILNMVQDMAGRGIIGIIGFALLAFGFLLQFVGNLLQAKVC